MFTRSFTSAVLLCALAGTTASAQVQVNDALDHSKTLFQRATPPAGMTDGGSNLEVQQFVYEIASPSDANIAGTSFGNGASTIAFDIGRFSAFNPLQAVPDPVPVNRLAFGWVWSGQTPLLMDAQITFFGTFDPTSTNAPFYSNVLGQARVNGLTSSAVPAGRQTTQWFQNGLQFLDAQGAEVVFNLPRDTDFGYEIRFLNPGTNDVFAQNSTLNVLIRGGPLQTVTGISDARRWFDGNFDGALAGTEFSGSAANRRDVYLKLQADINAPPPPNTTPVGAIDCNDGRATVVQADTVVPGEVHFYALSIPSDASVAADSFLDIAVLDPTFLDSVNPDIALYDANGNRVALNRDDGQGNGAQLSFGHGRRPANLDSVQFDGRDGDLAAGNYFLAVAGAGASFGSSSFSANASATIDAGQVEITFTTNTGSTGGCPLPTPVAPDATDLGALPAGVSLNNQQPGFGQVVWYKFQLPYSIDSANPQNFLDIDNLGSEDSNGNYDIALYDSAGVLVASDTNTGPGNFAQLSFGDPATHNVPGSGDGEPYNAQNGSTLPSGQYFLVTSLAALDAQGTGWQARTNTGSSNIVSLNFRTPTGCTLDLNGDGNIDPDDLSDAISCFFDTSCEFDFDGSTFEDPDDLSTYISGFFSGCP